MANREVVKEIPGPNGCKVYSDGSILVKGVRFSYPHVDAPWSKKETERKKFSLVGLMPKSTHRATKDAIKEVIDNMLTEKKQKPKIFPQKDKFLRDGNGSGKEEYQDHYTINASEERRPFVRGPDARPIPHDDIKDRIRPGFWGNMLIRPWWQDNEHGKKVNAGLLGVQLTRKDEEFGEGSLSEEDADEIFDEVYDDDDASGFDDGDDDEL